MPRVTARQAFARARTRRIRARNEIERTVQRQRTSLKEKTQPNQSEVKKITDYFTISSRLSMSSPKREPRVALTGRDDGVELITIIDSDADDNNNPENKPPNEISGGSDSPEKTSKIDDDVVVLEQLPPIHLRNHPVHDIDD